jgi:hypothetical protein
MNKTSSNNWEKLAQGLLCMEAPFPHITHPR